MDLKTSILCLVVLVCVSRVSSLPAQGHVILPGSPEVLRNIIVELENVLYKLKDYAREVQANRKDTSSGTAVDTNEQQLAASKTSSSSSDQKSKVPPAQSSLDTNDVSLKDALEYLVILAKEKKMERRDHDIPFPLTDQGRNADRESQ